MGVLASRSKAISRARKSHQRKNRQLSVQVFDDADLSDNIKSHVCGFGDEQVIIDAKKGDIITPQVNKETGKMESIKITKGETK